MNGETTKAGGGEAYAPIGRSDLVERLERVASDMMRAGLPPPPVILAAAAALTVQAEEIARLREALQKLVSATRFAGTVRGDSPECVAQIDAARETAIAALGGKP